MRNRHPLGRSRRARGVDDVRDLIGSRRRQRGAGLAVDSGITNIPTRDQQIPPIQPSGQLSGRDRGDRRGIIEHELIRASGTAGSIGTYVAPVFSTAKIATIASAERGNNNATRCPGPTPCPTNRCANRFDASSSSR